MENSIDISKLQNEIANILNESESEFDYNSIEGLMSQGLSRIEASELLDSFSRRVSPFRLTLILTPRLALAWESQRIGSEYSNDGENDFEWYLPNY